MSFPGFRQREVSKWIRSIDRKTLATIGAGAALVLGGFVLGALFGEPLVRSGIPVKVSDVPEINRLIRTVSRHITVNPGENPTVATVNDPALLSQQNPQFYKGVEGGDRLLVYSDRAILYSTKKDVILSEMVFPPQSGQAAASAQSLTFEIRNGVGTPGATKWLADRLAQGGIKVTGVADAKKTYPGTLVIPVSAAAKNADLQSLLPVTGGAVGELPAGEPSSSADILVILGKDQG